MQNMMHQHQVRSVSLFIKLSEERSAIVLIFLLPNSGEVSTLHLVYRNALVYFSPSLVYLCMLLSLSSPYLFFSLFLTLPNADSFVFANMHIDAGLRLHPGLILMWFLLLSPLP